MVVENICGEWFMTGLITGIGISLVVGFIYFLITKALAKQFRDREVEITQNVIKYLNTKKEK